MDEDRTIRGGSPRQALEITLFAVVFAAGAVLTLVAFTGESRIETTSASAEAPVPGPVAAPSLPPEVVLPPEGEAPGVLPGGEILTTGARADLEPNGCRALITFEWEVEQGRIPPGRPEALIEVDGPSKAGEYRRPVVNGKVTLELDVSAAEAGAWEGDLVSIEGQDVFPTPLPVSVTDAFC